MKKTILKYGCYAALSTSLLLTTLFSVACNKDVDIPKMSVSYGPEIGFADGNVNLSGVDPVINISDIKAEVGMNIDYLSGVNVENEADFPDLEIWVDASLVDIFTPGSYTVVYTFVYNDTSTSKEITVTLIESEQSASNDAPSNSGDNNNGNNGGSSQDSKPSTSNNSNKNTSEATTVNTGNNQTTASGNNNSTTAPSDNKPTSSTKDTGNNNTVSKDTSNSQTTSKVDETTSHNNTDPSNQTTTQSTTPVQSQTTTQKESTSRQMITSAGNRTTELKNIGNYTIELLSGKNITIKNTTSKYIVSTRTDTSNVDENGKTYRISKLIITYNTGFEQVLETVKERIK